MKILTNYDFNQNQLLNVSAQNLATAPSTPVKGQFYFNTGANRMFYWNGTGWTGADASDAIMTGADIVSQINGSSSLIDNDNLSTGVNTAVTKAHDAVTTSNTASITLSLTGQALSASAIFGTTAGTIAQGNDSRFTDSRTPKTHASTHITAGTDIIPNFTSTASGLAPLSGGGTVNFLRADGTWATPPDTNTVTRLQGTGGALASGDIIIQGTGLVSTSQTGNTITISTTANNYVHPTGDGNLHVPATSTTNNGKVLTAGATAGSLTWNTPSVDWTNVANKPTSTVANIDSAVTNSHTHSNKTLLDTYTQTEVNLASAVTLKHSQNTDNTLTNAGVNTIKNTTATGNIVDFQSGTTPTTKASVDTSGKFTGTIDWANINSKPSSTTANIDSAVTNSHTHSNKTLLDTYTQTEVNLASAVSLKHTQNTDTGTSSATFTIGTSGVKIKNSGGTELQLRNNADTAYADLRINNLYVQGTTTTINSNTVAIGDSNIELNTEITTNATNSDGGITVKRLKVDNVTRGDAVLNFNNSTGRWETAMGDVASVVTRQLANKFTASVGDGTTTSFVLTHNLGTQDIAVGIRETASPYNTVITDVACTDNNTITVSFAVAPTTNQYSVTVVG